MDIRFIGHTRILIDPFLSANPVASADAADPGELEPTHIFLTHGHFDHWGDVLDIARRTGAHCVAIKELADELQAAGVENVSDPNLGGTVEFGGGWVVESRTSSTAVVLEPGERHSV
jgi:L-ascorbate metabolism protein UlaG (beta-lactamase superfamily)